MAHPKLFLAGLCLMFILAASSVSAVACPADQTFDGTLLPGETDTISATTTVQGNTYFQFIPAWPFWGALGQTVTMSMGGSSVTGDGSLAMSIHNAAAGTYTVTLNGHYLKDETGVDGLAALPYQLLVYQSNCV
jgi:hypothetical protein